MKIAGWCRRLEAEFPGWKFWRSSPGGWNAVPAPDDADLAQITRMPNRVNVPGRHAGALRPLVRERYGWHDYCQSCPGMLARECGHRCPETRARP